MTGKVTEGHCDPKGYQKIHKHTDVGRGVENHVHTLPNLTAGP